MSTTMQLKLQFQPGKCLCGCGNDVPISAKTCTRNGWIAGQPKKYLQGHGCRGLVRKGQKLTVSPAKLLANQNNAKKRARPGSLIRAVMGQYKSGAARRKIPFYLTEDQFGILIQTSCFYCSALPNRQYRPTRYASVFICGGIDRRDNTQGYTAENCIPCCKICNQFKSDLTQEEMFAFVKRIYERHLLCV